METQHDSLTTYPSQYETEVVLTDGSAMILRPIKFDDVDRWVAFLSRLGADSRYFGLHNIPARMTPEDARRFCKVDYKNVFALVGEIITQQQREIVAVGRYYRLPRNIQLKWSS